MFLSRDYSHFGKFQKSENIFVSEVCPGHIDTVNLLFRREMEYVCVCAIVKKQDSRSMSLVERNPVISEIAHICSYLVTKA